MCDEDLTKRDAEDADEHDDDVAPDSEWSIVESDGAPELECLVAAPTEDRGLEKQQCFLFAISKVLMCSSKKGSNGFSTLKNISNIQFDNKIEKLR